MSKLDKASVVKSNTTNFFVNKKSLFANNISSDNNNIDEGIAQENNILKEKAVKKGRPVKINGKKDVQITINLSRDQKEDFLKALQSYNNSNQSDIFFQEISMNEFALRLIFSNPKFQTLLQNNTPKK
jgi:hypothetical protein